MRTVAAARRGRGVVGGLNLGPQPPPLHRYLEGYLPDAATGDPEECRQHWGYLARLLRELEG